MTRDTASAIGFHRDSATTSCFQSVILELPIAVRTCLLLGGDPLSTLKPMQSRIERAMLHLNEVVHGPLNVFASLM
jgi:hypothetical protein